MDCSGAWLIPKLSLQSELLQENDRRIAARLDKDTLHALVDDLIVQWYQHQSIVDQALGRVRQLEVELALCDSIPWDGHVSDEHIQMARELMAERLPAPADQVITDGDYGGMPPWHAHG